MLVNTLTNVTVIPHWPISHSLFRWAYNSTRLWNTASSLGGNKVSAETEIWWNPPGTPSGSVMFFYKFSQIYLKALERIRGIDGLTTVSEALQFVSSSRVFTVNQYFAFSITENVSKKYVVTTWLHTETMQTYAFLSGLAGSFSAWWNNNYYTKLSMQSVLTLTRL